MLRKNQPTTLSDKWAIIFACTVMLLILAVYGVTVTDSAPALIEGDDIRPPAVAGQFYPNDPEELRTMVDAFLQQAPRSEGEPIALMSPHAGYVFSGAVAARAYKQIEGTDYDVIVIIGPNHRDPTFNEVSIYAEGAFETPLGQVPIDTKTANALLKASDRLVFDRDVHSQEHSIEVQLPFLQRIYPDGFNFVPIVVGEPTEQNLNALRDALIEVLADKKALIIASSDMSHYPPYKQACEVDQQTLDAIETMDPDVIRACGHPAHIEALSEGIPHLGCTLCGLGPVLTATEFAEDQGANRATPLMYANSGDTPFGDRERVVGYGVVMWWHASDSEAAEPEARTADPPVPATGVLNEEQRTWLLDLAQTTLAGFINSGAIPLVQTDDPELLRPAGIFVTLKKDGELRGCIGHIVADTPLYLTVQKMVLAAAFQDSRFSPVQPDELPKLTYEISVLSPVEPVESAEDIEVGRHGVILLKDDHQAVFLPQVAPEQGWTREEMLAQLSQKAGLPPDAWKDGAEFLAFTADVFNTEGERIQEPE